MWFFLFLFSVLVVCLFIYTRNKEYREYLLFIFALALILRFGYALVANYWIAPKAYGTVIVSDSLYYEPGGWVYAQRWKGTNISYDDSHTQKGNVYYIAAIYRLVGHNPLAPRVMNAVLGAVSCLFVYLIAHSVFDKRIAQIAAFLTAINPGLIIFAGTFLKECLFVFLLCLIIWQIIELTKKFSWITIIITSSSLWYLSSVRYYVVPVVLILAVLYILLQRKVSFSTVAIISGIFAIILLNPFNLGLFSLSSFRIFGGVESAFYKHEVGADSFLADFSASSRGSILLHLPLIISRFLFSPLFWKVLSGNTLIAKTYIPGGFFWYLLIPHIVYGFGIALRHNRKKTFLLYSTVLLLSFMPMAVFWGGVRHRNMVMPLFHIFAAIGISNSPKWQREYILSLIGIVILVLSFYFFENVSIFIPLWGVLITMIIVLIFHFHHSFSTRIS